MQDAASGTKEAGPRDAQEMPSRGLGSDWHSQESPEKTPGVAQLTVMQSQPQSF